MEVSGGKGMRVCERSWLNRGGAIEASGRERGGGVWGGKGMGVCGVRSVMKDIHQGIFPTKPVQHFMAQQVHQIKKKDFNSFQSS